MYSYDWDKSEQKHTSFVLWTYLQENNPNWLFNHSQTRIYVKWLLFPLHFQSMQICLNNYKIRDSWGKISLTCLVALTDNDITWHACKVRITTIGFARLRNLPFEYVKGDRNSIMGLPIKDIINYINQNKIWKKILE